MGAVVKDTTRLKTHRKVIIKGMFLYSNQYLGLFIALYTSPPGRPVHSNAISTSLGSIQPRCNYCTKGGHMVGDRWRIGPTFVVIPVRASVFLSR